MTSKEANDALKFLIWEAQKEFPPCETTTNQLRLREDSEGLIRCYGRLSPMEQLDAETAYPLFISRESPLAGLVLRDIHQRLLHCGPSTLLTEYRQTYRTPKLRRLIRDYLYRNNSTKCTECYRHLVKPFKEPPAPSLPLQRLTATGPFVHVGIDFFGPFRIRTPNGLQKMYGAIFACLTTRAVHLEVCTDATTDRFLLALRRFIARRGCPSYVLSDNAKQFVLAGDLLRRQFRRCLLDDKVKTFLTNKGIACNRTRALACRKL